MKKKKKPGYYSKKNQFRKIRELRKVLGYYDSISNVTGAIVNDFILKCKDLNISPEAAVIIAAEKFKVKRTMDLLSIVDIKKG